MDNPSGTIPLSRNPKYMIRINQNSYPIVNDEIAIVAQYLDAKEDVNHFLDFDMHCPGWYAIDRLNAWQYYYRNPDETYTRNNVDFGQEKLL